MEKLTEVKLSILAKEKGFNEGVNNYYKLTGSKQDEYVPTTGMTPLNYNNYRFNISRPTLSHLQTWLRDVHNIIVASNHYEFSCENCNGWYYSIGRSLKTNYINHQSKTYEKALEVGLLEALNLIKC